jgi:hypothetical protein
MGAADPDCVSQHRRSRIRQRIRNLQASAEVYRTRIAEHSRLMASPAPKCWAADFEAYISAKVNGTARDEQHLAEASRLLAKWRTDLAALPSIIINPTDSL